MARVDSGRMSATTETILLLNPVGPETIEERPSEGGFTGPDEGDFGQAEQTRCGRAGLGEGSFSTDLCSGVVGAGVTGDLKTADDLDAVGLSSLAMQQGAIIGGQGTTEREGALSGTLSRSGPESHLREGYSWADSEAVPIVDMHDGRQYIMDFSSMPEIVTIVGGPYPEENYVRCPHAIPIVLCSNPRVSSNGY